MSGGRTAIVTGGSSGIGLGIVRGLLADGYAVTVVARREAKLAAAVDGLGERGRVRAVVADVRREDEVEAAVDAHVTAYGEALHVLVNNAGVAIGGSVERTPTAHIDLALAVNVRAAMLFSRAAAGALVAGAPSQVVNVASLTGLQPQAGMSAYSTSKAALLAYTESFRAEFAGRGVKATAIAPGFVDTQMADAVREHADPSELIEVDDVVEVVMCLLRLSPACVVPQVVLEGIGGGLTAWGRVRA